MRDKRCELGAHYGCSCDDRELVANRLEVERLRAAMDVHGSRTVNAPERTPLRYDIDDSDLRDVHMRAFELGGWVKHSDYAALEQKLGDAIDAGIGISEDCERLRAAIREVIRTADMPTEPGWHVTWPELEHARALTKPEGE